MYAFSVESRMHYQNNEWYIFIHFLDEYDTSTGLLIRTCEENVAVNKCEGQCASSIFPSALNAYGFQKVWIIHPITLRYFN